MKKTLLTAVLLAAALMTGMSPRAEAAPCTYETIGHGTAGFETAGLAGNGQSLEFYYSEDCNRAAVSLRSYAGDIQTVSGEPVLMAVLERAVFGVRVDEPGPATMDGYFLMDEPFEDDPAVSREFFSSGYNWMGVYEFETGLYRPEEHRDLDGETRRVNMDIDTSQPGEYGFTAYSVLEYRVYTIADGDRLVSRTVRTQLLEISGTLYVN